MSNMKARKLLVCIVLLCSTAYIYSQQQWDGSSTNANQINRFGNVSIIPTSNGQPYVDIANNKISLKKYNVVYPQYLETFVEITKDSIFYNYLAPGGGSTALMKPGGFNFYHKNTSKYCKFENGVLSTTGNFIANNRIGINTSSPSSRLHIQAEGDPNFIEGQVNGTNMHGIQIWGTDQTMLMGVNTSSRVAYIQSTDLWTAASTLALNVKGGAVTIGTVNNQGYKLAVNGGIICEELKVVTDVPASDYVFEPTYVLKSLKEVEDFILENKHLPEVPSAEEFKQNGYKVGEMDDLLLRKIEELTLYIIQQQKQIDVLQQQIQKQ